MHLGLGDGSRIDALVRTLFYLVGAPIFLDSNYNGSSNQTSVKVPDSVWSFAESSERIGLDNGDCYDDIGCFKTRYSKEKGYDLRPNALDEVTPTICLYTYTYSNVQACQVVEKDTIGTSLLELSNGSNYWITHGYIENGQRPWIKEMTKELLEYDNNANVFVIDWSEASKPPYNQAVENVEMIAAHCASIMVILEDIYGFSVNETHFIGHSLGAQLAGYLGAWLRENKQLRLGRISGLDPAQLYFEGLPIDARLDDTDALFVDVMHTDAKPFLNGGEMISKSSVNISTSKGQTDSKGPVSGLGIKEACGHADFYPNGGKDQPGCRDGVYQAILQEDGSVMNGIRRFLGCDHIRSYEYFTESIRSSCDFMAFSCESWQQFTSSSCEISHRNKMGFHAKRPPGNVASKNNSVPYYSITGSRSPFCRDHYKVTINLAQESKYRSTSELHLVLGNPTNGNGNGLAALNLGPTDFTGKNLGKHYTVSGVNVGLPPIIALRPSSSNPLKWLIPRIAESSEPDVVVRSVEITHLELMEQPIMYCPVKKNFFSISEQNPSISLSNDSC